MVEALHAQFVQRFQAELYAPSKPVNIAFRACMKLLEDYKLSYKVKYANPKIFLVHKANRGGLGLNPYNCHSNAASIFSVGADMNDPDGVVAFGLAPGGEHRDALITAGVVIAKQSQHIG